MQCPWRPEENTRSLGTGVTGSCTGKHVSGTEQSALLRADKALLLLTSFDEVIKVNKLAQAHDFYALL